MKTFGFSYIFFTFKICFLCSNKFVMILSQKAATFSPSLPWPSNKQQRTDSESWRKKQLSWHVFLYSPRGSRPGSTQDEIRNFSWDREISLDEMRIGSVTMNWAICVEITFPAMLRILILILPVRGYWHNLSLIDENLLFFVELKQPMLNYYWNFIICLGLGFDFWLGFKWFFGC